MVTNDGQNRIAAACKRPALKACQTLATTTGTAIRMTAIWAGNTSAINGTVNSGVPTPSVPLISPPQNSAKVHQAITRASNSCKPPNSICAVHHASIPSSTWAVCLASRCARSFIWCRQLKPSATSQSLVSVPRTAGSRSSSAILDETS